MDNRKKRGDRGEAAVADALSRRGYQVLERQYRCRWGEIDIIARAPDGTLCFVEVKTRSAGSIAPARDAVTAAKRRRLWDAAGHYLARTGLDCVCRFDVAEVYGSWDRLRINYITDAFRDGG